MDGKVKAKAVMLMILFGFIVFVNPMTSFAGNLFENVLSSKTITHIQNSINNAPNKIELAANQNENPPISAIAVPKILSVNHFYPTDNQTIIILGQGFGYHAPFNGDSRFIRIYDITRGWNAGLRGDMVTINVLAWTNSKIVIKGFTGPYGGGWSFKPGDHVEIMVWNPQSAAMDSNTKLGKFNLTVSN